MASSLDLRVNRQTLREQVFDALRDAIISGAMRAGDDLAETELAARFGVSRGTIREALRSLQHARLVCGDARGKLRVQVATTTEIAEIFSVRRALEGLAVRAIMAQPQLEESVSELRLVLPPEDLDGDFTTHMNLDLAFHARLCELSNNATLLDTWRGLEDRMRLVFFSSGAVEPAPIMARSQHEPIVEALASGDVAIACQTVAAHMNAASERWAPDVPVIPA